MSLTTRMDLQILQSAVGAVSGLHPWQVDAKVSPMPRYVPVNTYNHVPWLAALKESRETALAEIGDRLRRSPPHTTRFMYCSQPMPTLPQQDTDCIHPPSRCMTACAQRETNLHLKSRSMGRRVNCQKFDRRKRNR